MIYYLIADQVKFTQNFANICVPCCSHFSRKIKRPLLVATSKRCKRGHWSYFDLMQAVCDQTVDLLILIKLSLSKFKPDLSRAGKS